MVRRLTRWAGIGLFFLIASAWVGRSLLLRSGVIVFEDMAPLFSLNQLDEYVFGNWSNAMQFPSFRARSTPFLSVARYAPLMGIMTIALLALAGLFQYLSILLVIRLVYTKKLTFISHAVMSIVSFTISLVILMAYLTNYYAIGFSFSAMSLTLSLFLHGILSPELTEVKHSVVIGVAMSAVMSWVAAPQVIAILCASIGAMSLCIILLFRGRVKRVVVTLGVLCLLYVIPYVLYMAAVIPMSTTTEAVPVTYGLIEAGSASPLIFASGPVIATTCLYFLGRYQLPVSAWFVLQSCVLLAILVHKRYHRNPVVAVISSLYMFSFFFALGFARPISGYSIALTLLQFRVPFVEELSAILIRTLRTPHRWQFISFYCKGILLTLALLELQTFVASLFQTRISRKIGTSLGIGFSIVLLLAPFCEFPFSTLFSGDFGGAYTPVPIPQEMKEIKSLVHRQWSPGEKLVTYPPTGATIVRWNGFRPMVSSILYCFYFEVPSLKSAAGAPLTNQLSGTLGYYLLYSGEQRVGAYFASQGIRYIFFHDDVEQYRLPDERARVLPTLLSQDEIELVYQDGAYYLFRVNAFDSTLVPSKSVTLHYGSFMEPWRLLKEGLTPRDTVLVDLSSGEFGRSELESVYNRLDSEQVFFYFPESSDQTNALLSILSAEEGTRSFIGLCERLGPEFLGWISSDSVYVVARSYIRYAAPYGFFGGYGATESQMIMTTRAGQSVVYEIDVPQNGRYKLFLKLHAIRGTTLSVGLDERAPQIINVDPTNTYHFLELMDEHLDQGQHSLSVTTKANEPVVINMAYTIETGMLDEYTAWFNQFASHNVFSTSQDLIGHLRSLPPATEEDSIYYYSQNIYAPILRGKMGDETVPPVRVWYGQVAFFPSSPHSIDEIEVTYLPDQAFVRWSVITYMVYMTFLGIISLILLSGVRELFGNV